MAQVQQVSFLTQDHLGSPRVITNETGAVTTRQDFSAFGDETLTVQRTHALGYKPDELRKDYTGNEKDDETGLEFAQAKYYNPQHGRFTSVDPLIASANVKDPQTFNSYSYALNSPYKFTDPLGLMAMRPCGDACVPDPQGQIKVGGGDGSEDEEYDKRQQPDEPSQDSSNDRDKIAVLKGSLEFQGTIIADGEVNALGDIIFYIGSAELDEGKLQEFYSGADVFKVTLTVEVPKDTAELYPTGDQERIGDNHSYARPTGSGEASKNNNIDVGSKPTLGMSGRTNEPSNINKLTISEPVNGIVTVSFIAHFKSNKENNFNSVHVNIAGERSKREFFSGSFKVIIEPKSKTQNVDHLLKKKP